MFGPTFSRNIECDKPRRTFRKGPKCILTLTVEVIRSFFNTQEIVDNTIFSRNIVFDKPRRTLYTGPKGSPTLTVEVIRSFLQDLRGC